MDIPKKNASRVIGTKRPPAVEPIASAPVVQEIPQMPVQKEIPSVGRSVDFGNTVYVSSDDEEDNSTVILGSDNMVNVSINNGHPCIVRVKNKQKMYLDKPILKIGREASYVDFYIGDNSHVGRTHADIITKEDGYYIRDNNSSNHTFINGVQIAAGQLVKLQFNDKIALGDEEFVFMQN